MIRIPCYCGNLLNLPDSMAGGQIQCPRCSKLVEIPTIDELGNLTDDGTYRLDTTPAVRDPTRFAKLRRTYTRQTTDDTGQEIDLRGPQTPAEGSSADLVPLKEQEPEAPAPPKYDPISGERIREVQIQDENAGVPLNIAYAKPVVEPPVQRTNLIKPIAELLMPGSMVAMVFVFLTHVFLNLIIFALVVTGVITNQASLALLIPLIGAGLFAHFSNVVVEVGPEECDELPRFLRQFHLIEDVLQPFVSFMLAVAYCFAPAMIATHALKFNSTWQAIVVGILTGLGAIIFPAAFLTTTTSGALGNLRPDRVAGTIKVLGARYAFYMIVFVLAAGAYAIGIWATMMQAENWASQTPPAYPIQKMGPAYSLLSLGIFSMHYFLWHLGLAYRRDHNRFPWTWQRHEIDPNKYAPPPQRNREPKYPIPAGAESSENAEVAPAIDARRRLGDGARPPSQRPATRRPATRPPTNR